MAGQIKGITIQFNGDATDLNKALTEIKGKAKATDDALKEVNRALKFNPSNVTLLAQKQDLLRQKIEQTREKLNAFRQTQKQIDDGKVKATDAEYQKLKRDIIQAESQLKYFNKQLRAIGVPRLTALGKQFQTVGKQVATAGIKMSIAGAGLVYVGKKLVDLAVEQANQETKLTTIYRDRMGATEGAAKATMRLASALQKEGVIGDEVTLSGAQQLATFAKMPETVDNLLPALDNLLAQQKGLNASTSDAKNLANMLGKALQGQTGALKRVGISFSDAQAEVLKYGTEEERAAMLAQVINENVGQMNKALADTPAGKIQQAKNVLGDIGEQMGAVLLPAIADVAKWLSSKLLPKLEKMIQTAKDHPIIGKLALALTSILAVGGPLAIVLGGLTMGIGKLIGGISRLIPLMAGAGGLVGLTVAAAAAIALLAVNLGKAATGENYYAAEARKARKERQEAIDATIAQGEQADIYQRKLQNLIKKEKKSAEDKEKIKIYVDELNKSVNGLNLTYDEEADKLNMSTKAIKQKIKAYKQEALAQAYRDQMAKAAETIVQNEQKIADIQKQKIQWQEEYDRAALAGDQHRMASAESELAQIDRNLKALKTANREAQAEMESYGQKTANITAGTSKSWDQAVAKAKSAGVKIPKSLKKGIEDGSISAEEGAEQLMALVNKKLSQGANSAKVFGADYIRGLAAGFTERGAIGTLTNAIKYVTDYVKKKTAKGLDEKSPSKIAAKYGGWWTEGLAIGLTEETPELLRAANNQLAAVRNTYAGARLATAPVGVTSTASAGNASLSNEMVNAFLPLLQAIAGGRSGEPIQIVNYLYPGGPQMGESIVRTYDTYKPRVG